MSTGYGFMHDGLLQFMLNTKPDRQNQSMIMQYTNTVLNKHHKTRSYPP